RPRGTFTENLPFASTTACATSSRLPPMIWDTCSDAVAARVPLPPMPADTLPSPASVTVPEITPSRSVMDGAGGVTPMLGSRAGALDGAVVAGGSDAGAAVGPSTVPVASGAAALAAACPDTLPDPSTDGVPVAESSAPAPGTAPRVRFAGCSLV